MVLEEKYFSCFIELTDNSLLSVFVFTSWDIGKYLHLSHRFWNNSYLSYQAVCSAILKSQPKNLNMLRTKKAFKMIETALFIIFKVLWSKSNNCLEVESSSLMLSLFFRNETHSGSIAKSFLQFWLICQKLFTRK